MARIGIIAEKPSQARNFCHALFGSERTSRGRIGTDEVEVVALRGHLFELVDPDKMYKGAESLREWSLERMPWDETRFAWKFARRGDVADVVAAAKRVLSAVDEIVIACDDDPGTHEGSGLACEVLLCEHIAAACYSRMYFVDESAPEVVRAFKERKLIPAPLEQWGEWKVAYFRNRWDYLAGLQSTRAATVLGDGAHTIRCGRLKSAMVAIVAAQLDARDSWRKVLFYENRFRDEAGVVYTNPDEPRCASRQDVAGGLHASDVVVDSVSRKRTAPPRLMDLASISAALAPAGISAKQVLDTYQVAYEKYKYLSYPRTEDKTITPEQYNELLSNMAAIARVVGIDASWLTHVKPRPTHVKPKGAHGANRPGPNVPATLADVDAAGPGGAMIYELVARSALAMFAEDYEYDQQKGHVKDYPAYVGCANIARVVGWHAVLSRDMLDDAEGDCPSGLGTRAEPFVHEGFTPRPQAPTMKWLMSQLERRRVGTGATRTRTYSDVTTGPDKSRLMNDKKGKIELASAGKLASILCRGTNIASLDLTERVFDQMAAIEAGTLDADDALHEIAGLVRDDIQTMRENARSAGIAAAPAREVVEGVFAGERVSFSRVWARHRFTDDELERLLAGDTVEIRDCVGKSGNTFSCRGRLASSTFKGKPTFGFVACEFIHDEHEFPASYLGHRFTKEETRAIRDEGRCILIRRMKSRRSGKVFDAGVSWTSEEGIKLAF